MIFGFFCYSKNRNYYYDFSTGEMYSYGKYLDGHEYDEHENHVIQYNMTLGEFIEMVKEIESKENKE